MIINWAFSIVSSQLLMVTEEMQMENLYHIQFTSLLHCICLIISPPDIDMIVNDVSAKIVHIRLIFYMYLIIKSFHRIVVHCFQLHYR